jgi:hypothetical protein
MLLRVSTSRRVDGLWIGGSRQREGEAALDRVERALMLIALHDPVRYRRILRDLERIWVHLVVGGGAEFDASLLACKLDERFVLDESTPTEVIAAMIVHEATHARLWHYGIPYDAPIRHRIEAICARREIAFANRLPDGALTRDQAQDLLSLCADPSYWSGVAFAERYPDGMRSTLRHLGMPEFLVRTLVATYGWRRSVQAVIRDMAARGFGRGA